MSDSTLSVRNSTVSHDEFTDNMTTPGDALNTNHPPKSAVTVSPTTGPARFSTTLRCRTGRDASGATRQPNVYLRRTAGHCQATEQDSVNCGRHGVR